MTNQPDTDARRERYAAAILDALARDTSHGPNWDAAAEAVMAVADREQRAHDAEVRAATLTAAADGLVAGCPHHGENGGWFMTCQCEGADELRKAAAAARPDDTTGA